jgi:type IV pilus assembly protein PilF
MLHLSARAVYLAAILMLLSACVTTTTGGFNVDSSSERAVRDYIQLAIGYYEAGDMAGAKRHINNALAINDRSSEAYNVQALIMQREGEPRLAQENFERSLSLSSKNSRARNNFAAFLFEQQRFEDAYRQLEIVANDTAYEARALAFENLGFAALRTERTDRAAAAFERALQLNQNLYRSSLELAQMRFDAGLFAASLRYYKQFVVTAGFYNMPQTPRSLWLGIQLERRFDNSAGAAVYGQLLESLYRDSPEYQRYINSAND